MEYEGRRSPRLVVELGETTLYFTYMNTYLVGFENCYQDQEGGEQFDYSHMNHIKHLPDGTETPEHIYESPDLYRQLAELAFTRILKPYPEEEDIEDYAKYFEAQLNGEVTYYGDEDGEE